MFYANEMVRLPDSPRHQNAECWLGGKSIRTANKTVQQSSVSGLECPTIDLLKLNDSIHNGVLRLEKPRTDRIIMTYKHGAGIYTQYGNQSGKIDIPLPDIYLVIDLTIRSRENGYQTHTNDIYIGSEYLSLIPLTNLFTEECHPQGRVTQSNGKEIHYTKMCHHYVLDSMVGIKNTALEIINNVIINIPALLFTHGNNDIDLMGRNYGCRYNAEYITENVFEHYLDYTEYAQYWYLLNYLMQYNDNAEDLYEKLSKENISDYIRSLNKSSETICREFQTASTDESFPVNYSDDYDEDYDDDDYDEDYDEDDDW